MLADDPSVKSIVSGACELCSAIARLTTSSPPTESCSAPNSRTRCVCTRHPPSVPLFFSPLSFLPSPLFPLYLSSFPCLLLCSPVFPSSPRSLFPSRPLFLSPLLFSPLLSLLSPLPSPFSALMHSLPPSFSSSSFLPPPSLSHSHPKLFTRRRTYPMNCRGEDESNG